MRCSQQTKRKTIHRKLARNFRKPYENTNHNSSAVGVSIPKEIVLEIEFITVGVEYHVRCIFWSEAKLDGRQAGGREGEEGTRPKSTQLLKGMTKETNEITIIKTNNTTYSKSARSNHIQLAI